jgi:hypothetical protein
MRIGFKLVDKWLRIEIENLSTLAISWHWTKDAFTAADGQVYTVAYFADYSTIAGKYEAGPLEGYVPTIKNMRKTANITSVIPSGRTLYNYICLVKEPKEYQYYTEHAYEDPELRHKRAAELREKYYYQVERISGDTFASVSDPYLDFLPRLPSRSSYGEYRWKVKYYLGEELKDIELVFRVAE